MSIKTLFIVSLTATSVLIALLSLQAGPLPPPGIFFHPVKGFWSNAELHPDSGRITIPAGQLQDTVAVHYSRRGVPHIFARNDHDLYFAQGYVTARDRLFQMELQVMAAAGRLSEWLGPSMLNHDLHQRRMGMVYGAEQTLVYLRGDETEAMIDAYTAGINAYIRSLKKKRYPLEYKLLNTRPEAWTRLKTALLLKYMTQMLAGRSQDIQTSNTIAFLGKEFVEKYISRPSKWTDPIIPSGHKWDMEPIEAVKPKESFTPQWVSQISPYQPHPANGSNNWALDGSRTASGYPVLAGDPHLAISVPSIWYEVQLHAPGINVYGVSIPGTPSVILGFNEDIAWSSTNTGADLMDWYEVEFRDASGDEYLHAGIWKPVTRRIEEIRVKGGYSVTDTVTYTHHGPVLHPEGGETNPPPAAIGHALKWIGHIPSGELRSYYKLNRAGSVEEAISALKDFSAPAQNFALADRHGAIALQIAGKFPVRWKNQGQTISDGRNPLYDWQEWMPYDHNPAVVNPERGFVSSANQIPADSSYAYYLGDNYHSFERGRRINDRLADMKNATADDMRLLQLDNYSYLAELALPVMLENLRADNLSPLEQKAAERLKNWDFYNLGSKIAPSVFHLWWNKIYDSIWSKLNNHEWPVRIPPPDRTLQMIIEEPRSTWYDDPDTAERETLSEVISRSFHESVSELQQNMNGPVTSWQWGNVNRTDLKHIAKIPGLGVSGLFTDGSGESPNAIRNSHGPSWRMVVELGPDLKAYGVYPGGQSGNPGSLNYSRYTETWREGELYELSLLGEEPGEHDAAFPLLLTLE